ncbi:hypothetical protein MNBD_GAMMA26-1201 [hydrothermal vent metagenome]|uniref:Oxaloacetate decarboxylase gamma chain n=1 Tax=hydrothermal vent metagenome TaxID=652676 RepID=A0A3B1BEE0_9ZZZZ
MPFSELMMAGVQLMLLGMGIVFTFLMILVATMTGMSRLAQALSGDQLTVVPEEADEALVAVISAAIRRYRDTH